MIRATVIDVGALLKVLYSSLIAGVSVAVVFSAAILGATRSSDLRRVNRTTRATAYGALAVRRAVLSVAIVVYGSCSWPASPERCQNRGVARDLGIMGRSLVHRS